MYKRQAFIRIPFGTAALEETAFRAVLPAVFAVRWGVLRLSLIHISEPTRPY